ncbi:MAG: thioredoxin domain-containing protein [Deltaproteobacteria bacterium]|nr:thioredoxin domain-containing protein [Deltaproteobacteria bacterium]
METTNRLIHEKSPYLLQHSHNPVDWYPWGDAAFSRAKSENKPVFLSVGYATCHWCHVMEKESFENPEAARALNDAFICIKVDREERPDIDAVYMAACQLLTGRGGWPLTALLTPDKEPFFAATYMPLHSRFGQPGILDLCAQITTLWQEDLMDQGQKILNAVSEIKGHLLRSFEYRPSLSLDESLLGAADTEITRRFDSRFGGFEPAPKFPSPHRLLFLLQRHEQGRSPEALNMVETTLSSMRAGGIWDHVGFGFHRYSTDTQWLLPHFEKMLYDQALLALAFLETYRITRKVFYARTAEEIFAYVLRDMTSEAGAFFTAEDADSEGEEGRFYVWPFDEFRRLLAPFPAHWETLLNASAEGNFHDEATGRKSGTNILHTGVPLFEWAPRLHVPEADLIKEWEDIRSRLFAVRSLRVHPLKDDKVLTDWNGLMIAALATGARILENPVYARVAARAADFILTNLRTADGRLFHRYREGQAGVPAFADDYAWMIFGLLSLHRADGNPRWLARAIGFQGILDADYRDREQGGYFMNLDPNDLPVRPKALYDGAMPSANSVSLVNLTCLYDLTGDKQWMDQAVHLAVSFFDTVKTQPSAHTFFLTGLSAVLQKGNLF